MRGEKSGSFDSLKFLLWHNHNSELKFPEKEMHQYLYNLKRTSVVALQKTDTDHYLKLEGWIKSSQVYGPYRKDGLGNHSCVFLLLAKFPLQ